MGLISRVSSRTYRNKKVLKMSAARSFKHCSKQTLTQSEPDVKERRSPEIKAQVNTFKMAINGANKDAKTEKSKLDSNNNVIMTASSDSEFMAELPISVNGSEVGSPKKIKTNLSSEMKSLQIKKRVKPSKPDESTNQVSIQMRELKKDQTKDQTKNVNKPELTDLEQQIDNTKKYREYVHTTDVLRKGYIRKNRRELINALDDYLLFLEGMK